MNASSHPRLADDLARFGFGGRLAIWGIVLPLAGLVVAWSANDGKPVTAWSDVEEEGWVPVGS